MVNCHMVYPMINKEFYVLCQFEDNKRWKCGNTVFINL